MRMRLALVLVCLLAGPGGMGAGVREGEVLCVRACVRESVRACVRACMRVRVCACVCANMHACMRTGWRRRRCCRNVPGGGVSGSKYGAGGGRPPARQRDGKCVRMHASTRVCL